MARKKSGQSKRQSGKAGSKSAQSTSGKARPGSGVSGARRGKKTGGAAQTHVAVPGSRRVAARGAVRIADVDPNAPVEITVTLRGPKLPDANQLVGRRITPEELATQYSASQEDADAVIRVLQRFGLRVEDVSLPTRSLRVSGTAKQMEAAFRPNLGIYRSADQGEFRDRQDNYQVPRALKGIVTAILGFGQRRVARRRAAEAATVPKAATATEALAPLSPQDIEEHYAFPAGDGSGRVIGIAEFGGGYFAEDLAAYCTKQGRPVPPVSPISVNRPAYTLQQIRQLPAAQRKEELDASMEVMLDVELIAGLCPKAQLNVYFATFDQKGWVDLLNRVVLDKPVALSISWGLAEDDPEWSSAALTAINERLNAAAALGITVCVAAGDDGSGDQESDGRAHVDFPSTSPFVLSVGGTMMTGSALADATESVWWESPGRRTSSGGGSTGGGVSVIFARPQWQAVKVTSLNAGSIDGRVIPDVAALAGTPYYDIIVLGGDAPNGGTSASAPVWAALVARVDALLPEAKQQRFLTPLLYTQSSNGKPLGQSVCRDITAGNNISNPDPGVGYKAGKGYDAVSGWGTPIGTALLQSLSASD